MEKKKKDQARIKFYINRDCSALSTTSSSSLSESDDSVLDMTPRWRGTLEEMWTLIGEDAVSKRQLRASVHNMFYIVNKAVREPL